MSVWTLETVEGVVFVDSVSMLPLPIPVGTFKFEETADVFLAWLGDDLRKVVSAPGFDLSALLKRWDARSSTASHEAAP